MPSGSPSSNVPVGQLLAAMDPEVALAAMKFQANRQDMAFQKEQAKLDNELLYWKIQSEKGNAEAAPMIRQLEQLKTLSSIAQDQAQIERLRVLNAQGWAEVQIGKDRLAQTIADDDRNYKLREKNVNSQVAYRERGGDSVTKTAAEKNIERKAKAYNVTPEEFILLDDAGLLQYTGDFAQRGKVDLLSKQAVLASYGEDNYSEGLKAWQEMSEQERFNQARQFVKNSATTSQRPDIIDILIGQ